MTEYRKGNKGVVDVVGERVHGWWQYGDGMCRVCENDEIRGGLLLHRTGTSLPLLFLCLSCVAAMWELRPVAEEVAP